jgi:hypothetical protein
MPYEPKPLAFVKCPHCGVELKTVETRAYGSNIVLIACPACLKVLAGNFNPQIQNP